MMIESMLQNQLRPAVARHRRLSLARTLGGIWSVAALAAVGLYAWDQSTGAAPSVLAWALLLGAGLTSAWAVSRLNRTEPDTLELARRIEQEHPELQQLLRTALEQKGEAGATLGYLQQRVIREAIDHAVAHLAEFLAVHACFAPVLSPRS